MQTLSVRNIKVLTHGGQLNTRIMPLKAGAYDPYEETAISDNGSPACDPFTDRCDTTNNCTNPSNYDTCFM